MLTVVTVTHIMPRQHIVTVILTAPVLPPPAVHIVTVMPLSTRMLLL